MLFIIGLALIWYNTNFWTMLGMFLILMGVGEVIEESKK